MDAFNFMPMLNNLWFASDAAGPTPAVEPLPWQTGTFDLRFQECGIWIANRPEWYAIVGLSKGGTASLFDKADRRLVARHAGLIAYTPRHTYASQDCCMEPPVTWSADETAATFNVPWRGLNPIVFEPWTFMLFRLFTLTLGRFNWVSRGLKDMLVRVLIHRKRRPPVQHTRTVTVDDRGIDIADSIEFPNDVLSVSALSQFTAVHMGSSLYADVRAVAGSTRAFHFEVARNVLLRGHLDLSGVSWQVVTR
jgi:hypothetical protein